MLVADCDGLDELKEFVSFDLQLIKQLFPMVSVGPHQIVFSQDEFRYHYMVRQPFVFSFKEGVKVLYADDGDTYKLDYSLEHELAYLVHIWTKFLILMSHDQESPYFVYLYAQIWKLLDDTELRITGKVMDSTRTNRPTLALVLRIDHCYRAAFKRLHGRGPATAVTEPDGGVTEVIQLPHYVYLENQSLDTLCSANAPGPVLSLQLVDKAYLLGLSELELLHSVFRSSSDAFLMEGLIFPLRQWDKLGLPILNPDANPLTFGALHWLMECPSGEKWQWEDYVRSLPATFVPDSVVEKRNKVILETLPDRLARMFASPAPTLSFSISVLAVWHHIIMGGSHEAGTSSLLSDSNITKLRTIMACIDQQKHSEAFFKTRNYLAGLDLDPQEVTISVLVPTRNRSDLLVRALDSIVRQTVQPFEVIVVDNGPDERTRVVVNESEERIPYIRYVEEPRVGIPHARNRALAESSGDVDMVVFMDDDCCAANDWLYEMALPFQYDADVVSAGGTIPFSASDRSFWGDFYFLRETGSPL